MTAERRKARERQKKRARNRKYERQPWNDMHTELALYVSPALKAKFDLPAKVWAYGEAPPL